METRYALQNDLETSTLDQMRSVDLQNFGGVMAKLHGELNKIEMLFHYVHECWWDEGPNVWAIGELRLRIRLSLVPLKTMPNRIIGPICPFLPRRVFAKCLPIR
jgi:hypothetical protein